jgi:hypothetical protein
MTKFYTKKKPNQIHLESESIPDPEPIQDPELIQDPEPDSGSLFSSSDLRIRVLPEPTPDPETFPDPELGPDPKLGPDPEPVPDLGPDPGP